MRSTALIALALLPMLHAGCGGESTPEVVPVTGRVTFEGEPVAGASVDFVPEQGRPATAITDENGEFTLSTFEPDDGAVPGKHTATVILNNPGDAMIIAGQPSENSIPFKYTVPDTTPFKFDVTPGEENHFELAMTTEEQAKKK